jgi:Lon protease-like protein
MVPQLPGIVQLDVQLSASSRIMVLMQEELLPLFPLQVVLFPRTPLPLHIFEERYKQMIADVSRAHSEFGVVLAGEKGIVNTGCTATVEKVLKKYPDGRMDLISIGRRRFEIILLNDEKSYLRGAVEYFDDEGSDPIPPEVRERVFDSYNDLRSLQESEPLHEPELSDPQLSFQLAQVVPDLDFRQMLLGTRSEADRMRRLAEFFPSYSSRQRQIQHARAVAPTNGHAKRPPGV